MSLVTNRWIDFIRIHVSAVGGLNMCRKVMLLCEFFNVRTAWHGHGNVSPVGHAVNVHLDLAAYNFGIQEQNFFSDTVREVFPGAPEIKGGYMYSNDRPGLGVDIDEKLAAKFPYKLPAAAEATTAGRMALLFGREVAVSKCLAISHRRRSWIIDAALPPSRRDREQRNLLPAPQLQGDASAAL